MDPSASSQRELMHEFLVHGPHLPVVPLSVEPDMPVNTASPLRMHWGTGHHYIRWLILQAKLAMPHLAGNYLVKPPFSR